MLHRQSGPRTLLDRLGLLQEQSQLTLACPRALLTACLVRPPARLQDGRLVR